MAALVVQAVSRVEGLTMFRMYRMIFELCWYQPAVVIAVLNSLESREWELSVRSQPDDAGEQS